MGRNEVQSLVVPAIDVSKFGVAKAHSFLQHGLENRLKVARSATDDLEHFGGGSLSLQRVREIGCAFGEVSCSLA